MNWMTVQLTYVDVDFPFIRLSRHKKKITYYFKMRMVDFKQIREKNEKRATTWCETWMWPNDWKEKKHCRNSGLNQGPLDLQSNALSTELLLPFDMMSKHSSCWALSVGCFVKLKWFLVVVAKSRDWNMELLEPQLDYFCCLLRREHFYFRNRGF